MKNLLTACLPALALFALGGCAGTSALTSSEDDGVYYSSKDRTTAVVRAVPAPASASEEANPDYNGAAPSSSARQGNGSTQYYDNNYTYMRGVPGYGGTSAYYGAGLNGYSPYSPYTTLSYSPFGSVCTGFGYGWGGGACGYSPYAYGGYDPFYSSFYSPYGYGYSPYYGYGSGLSISFGFGRPYYGGYGYSPYGYGYGYSPYYYGGSNYGGYYGRGGYYGNSYGGGYYGNSYGGNYGSSGDNRGSGRTYGHRTDRASEDSYSAAPAAGTGTGGSPTSGHGRSERPAANGGLPQEVANEGRTRTRRDGEAPTGGYNNQPQRMDDTGRPRYRDMDMPVAADPNTGRTRADGTQPQGQPATAPEEGRRRGGFFQNVFGEQPTGGGQAAEQPRQRTYEQPRQRAYEQPRQQTYEQSRQQTYEQPRQQTYEQPRQQTYEQPQRSYSQPSYSSPSGGGGGGGGGHRSRD